jgi:hypothetical protein
VDGTARVAVDTKARRVGYERSYALPPNPVTRSSARLAAPVAAVVAEDNPVNPGSPTSGIIPKQSSKDAQSRKERLAAMLPLLKQWTNVESMFGFS